jgi:hypothetical protein
MNFPYTTHSQQGVTCVDCHVNHTETAERTAHTVPDHSFNANLASCNTCHAQQRHAPTQNGEGTTVSASATTAQPTQGAQLASVTPEPEPVSPIGFSALAALLGLAGGMVLAPWLERWYQRVAKHDQEDKND